MTRSAEQVAADEALATEMSDKLLIQIQQHQALRTWIDLRVGQSAAALAIFFGILFAAQYMFFPCHL